jgi:1,4-dihydroxy-6-naphthoate synthase
MVSGRVWTTGSGSAAIATRLAAEIYGLKVVREDIEDALEDSSTNADFTPQERSEINGILRESIEYGLTHRAAGVAHALPLGRGMGELLADQFIGMYVNDYTLDYGDSGRAAIREFLGRAHKAGLIPAPVALEFVE